MRRRNGDFTAATKRLVAERAAFRCSLPQCGVTTIGPDQGANGVVSVGVACHIYSASPGGARGSGGLTVEERRRPENAIWLCGNHARVIDANGGEDFSAARLLSYKARHERKVAQEIGGRPMIAGWLEECTIVSSPLFARNAAVPLGKTTLVVGSNGSGKTALCEWVAGFADPKRLARWQDTSGWSEDLVILLKSVHPGPRMTSASVARSDGTIVTGDGDGSVRCLEPWLAVVFPIDPERADFAGLDDRAILTSSLGVTEANLQFLMADVEKNGSGLVRNFRGAVARDRSIRCDVAGTIPGLAFSDLSRSEKRRVQWELACAAARAHARSQATLLILDDFATGLDTTLLEAYLAVLSEPSQDYQTVVTSLAEQAFRSRIHWAGWEVAWLWRAPRKLVHLELGRIA